MNTIVVVVIVVLLLAVAAHIIYAIALRYDIKDRVARTGRRVVKISRCYDLTGDGTLQVPDWFKFQVRLPNIFWYCVYKVVYETNDGISYTSYLPFHYGSADWGKFYNNERR